MSMRLVKTLNNGYISNSFIFPVLEIWASWSTMNDSEVKGRRPYPFCHAKRQSDVLNGWMGKNKFIMTFCVTKWSQRKSQFKRKNIIKKKITKYARLLSILSWHFFTWFLHSAFVISPRKEAPTSHYIMVYRIL